MSHLTESILNEYLDKALEQPACRAADAHLASCPACRAQLDDLQSVFCNLSLLEEKPLACDLIPGVLTRLPRETLPLGWRLALAIQAGLAMGLLGAVAQAVLRFLRSQVDTSLLGRAWIDLFDGISFRLPAIDSHTLGLSGYSLPFSAPATLIILVLVIILWGLGNARLLQNGYEA